MHEFTIGFVPFGEINTPAEAILSRSQAALAELRMLGYPIVDTAPVTDDPQYVDADRAIEELSAKRFDMLVVCVAGWIPTHAVIRVIDHFRHLPMLLWSLCGWQEGAKLISTADQAGATALSYAMRGMHYRYHYIYSVAGQPLPMDQIVDYVEACHAAFKLRDCRIGSAGYRDMLLYGTMFDGMSLRRVVGAEVEPFEMLEIEQRAQEIPENAVADAVRFVREVYAFKKECDDETIAKCARYALAIARKIRERNYDAITLVDVDGFKKLLGLPPAMIFMLLDRFCGVCTIPENDILGSVTQLMVRYATGQIGGYLEFYEFFEDTLLAGVPDFIPSELTDGQPVIDPNAFGLLSTSLLNVSKVRDGEVTMVRLLYLDGEYTMQLVRGTATQPRAWSECGW